MIEKLSTSLREGAITIYEQAVQEGKIEGKSEGNFEKENLVITNATKEGFGIDIIAELTGLLEVEVKDQIKGLGLEK